MPDDAPATAPPLSTRPLARFGLEVQGIDLTAPMPEPVFAAIRAALFQSGVLLFRNQNLSPAAQTAFSRRFGALEIHGARAFLHAEAPEVVVIGNLRENGQPRALFARGDEQWHADSSFRAVPSQASLFYAVTVPPEGGDTWVADARAAFATLPPALKARAIGRIGLHDRFHLQTVIASRNPGNRAPDPATRHEFPPVRQPLLARHPITGEGTLFVCPDVMTGIEGMEDAEARTLIQDLVAHATQPHNVYKHVWRQGDLLIWDNRAVLHTASPFDSDRYLRVMHRTTVEGAAPLEAFA